jgi:transposase
MTEKTNERRQGPVSKADSEEVSVFKKRLDNILDRALTPDTIDSYAEDALTELVQLAHDAADSYKVGLTATDYSDRSLEDGAFKQYGMGDVEGALDYVVIVADKIRDLDGVIGRAIKLDKVITPPDDTSMAIEVGNGGFESKTTIPRLKTVLLILSENFGIDVDDSDQLELKSGHVNDSMIRKDTYYSVEVDSLGRTILVCDEEGNVTFVFDTTKLNGMGISSDDLVALKKSEIGEMLDSDPALGRRIIYSNRFVPAIIESIEDLSRSEDDIGELGAGYLRKNEATPEGIMFISTIANSLSVAHSTVKMAVKELEETGALGESRSYKLGNGNVTRGFDEHEVAIITQYLSERGKLAEKAPADIMSINDIADSLDMSDNTVRLSIQELDETGALGEPKSYRFGTNVARGFDEQQVAIITQYLSERGKLAEKAPEDIMSINDIVGSLGVSDNTVRLSVKELYKTGALGESKSYRFRKTVTRGFDEHEVAIITQYLSERGNLAEMATEGILSINDIAVSLGVSEKTVGLSIQELDETGALGESKSYRFRKTVTRGFDEQQVVIITQYLSERGNLAEKAPKDIMPIKGIAQSLGVADKTVKLSIEELDKTGALGEPKSYMFVTKITRGFDQNQQAIIREVVIERLRRRGRLLVSRAGS